MAVEHDSRAYSNFNRVRYIKYPVLPSRSAAMLSQAKYMGKIRAECKKQVSGGNNTLPAVQHLQIDRRNRVKKKKDCITILEAKQTGNPSLQTGTAPQVNPTKDVLGGLIILNLSCRRLLVEAHRNIKVRMSLSPKLKRLKIKNTNAEAFRPRGELTTVQESKQKEIALY